MQLCPVYSQFLPPRSRSSMDFVSIIYCSSSSSRSSLLLSVSRFAVKRTNRERNVELREWKLPDIKSALLTWTSSPSTTNSRSAAGTLSDLLHILLLRLRLFLSVATFTQNHLMSPMRNESMNIVNIYHRKNVFCLHLP